MDESIWCYLLGEILSILFTLVSYTLSFHRNVINLLVLLAHFFPSFLPVNGRHIKGESITEHFEFFIYTVRMNFPFYIYSMPLKKYSVRRSNRCYHK